MITEKGDNVIVTCDRCRTQMGTKKEGYESFFDEMYWVLGSEFPVFTDMCRSCYIEVKEGEQNWSGSSMI